MGWTTFNFNGTKKEFLESEFNREPNWGTIIDSSIVGSTIYAAVKLGSNHGERAGLITALIIMTSNNKKEHYNFGYKDMTEGCGPHFYKCPKRIINLLSPVDDLYDADSSAREYATNWRNKCTDKPKLAKIPFGAIIKTKEPLRFSDGIKYSYFKHIFKNLWVAYVNQDDTAGFNVKFMANKFEYEILK
jgi:hypothetical protein